MDCFLEYENNQKVIITDRDVKKFMTPEDRIIPKDRLDQTQKINERFKRAEIGMRIANPEKVFGKVYRGKECKIFVTVDDDGTVRSAILNTKSGRLLIDTKLSDKEYASLQDDTSSRFDLTDLRGSIKRQKVDYYAEILLSFEFNDAWIVVVGGGLIVIVVPWL